MSHYTRSISVSGDTYRRLRRWCGAHQITSSKAVELALAAEIAAGAAELQAAGRVETRVGTRRPVRVTLIGSCAICAAVDVPVVRIPLDPGGPFYNVCVRCDEEAPRQGNYSFGGGALPRAATAREKGAP